MPPVRNLLTIGVFREGGGVDLKFASDSILGFRGLVEKKAKASGHDDTRWKSAAVTGQS